MRLPTVLAALLLLCAVCGAARAEQPSEEQLAARALAERRQTMIDDCVRNHGSEIDCKRETDTELRAEGLQWGARVIHLRPAR
jgi:hypothetical protein